MNNFFNYQGFQVTVQTINFEPWFLAKDIANILMLKNPSMMIRHAKISKYFVRKIATNTLGGKQKCYI
jgi:Prophage antirepressor